MAASTVEVLLKFTGDPRNAKDAIAQVRADLTKSAQEQVTSAKNVNKQVASEAKNQTKTLEKEERDRLKSAESLQRQRSAALIAAWKAELREKQRIEKEKEQAEKGGGADFTLLLNKVPVLSGITSQFSSLTAEAAGAATAMAGVAVGIGIVVAAAGIAVGVLVKLGTEIFELTKQTAEFQGKFFDLSQQVGVSVETLSALDVMAQRTGGNIDTVTASLGIFQKHLEASHDPTSKEAKLLADLGVTTTDTELALRQAIRGLFNLGETSEQTDKVLQLFGRSGRFVNAILKESKGELDEASKGMKGMLVTQQAAAAADAFNDSLGDLQRVLAGLTRAITTDSIPVFTLLFQEITIGLVGSAEGWNKWSREVADAISFTIANIKALIQFIGLQGTVEFDTLVEGNFFGLMRQAEKLRSQNLIDSQIDQARRLAAIANAGRPGDRPDADKSRSEAASRANKELQLQQQALEESTRRSLGELDRQRRLDLISIDEWEDRSNQAAFDHRKAQEAIFDQELGDARKFIKNREDLRLVEIENLQKRTKAVNQEIDARQKIQEDAQKKRDQLELKLNAQLLQITEAARQQELAIIQRALARQEITEEGAAIRQLALLKETHDQRLILLDLELKQQTTSAERKTELDNEKIKSEQEYTRQVEELTQKRIDALLKEGAARVPSPKQKEVPSDRGVVPTVPINIGLPPPQTLTAQIDQAIQAQGAFAGLGVAISDSLGQGKETAIAFAETITESFGMMAQAVGDSVKAFLLFGTAQGSFRKFAAEIIASIAQMAVVQALWEGAQALAMMALTWFTGNPKYAQSAGAHWAAAAAYGLIAGVTAPLARLTAGNAFAQQDSGGGGGTARTSSTGTTASEPKTVEFDRNTRNQQQVVTVLVNVTRDPGSIVEAVVLDGRSGGPIRQLIQSEMAS